MINIAAAWVKPLNTGTVTTLSSQSRRAAPKMICIKPANKANRIASNTHWAGPTTAIGASAAAVEDPTSAAARRDVLLMERQGANANRPVPNGACCVAHTRLKQHVRNVTGQTGRCVPDSINNCKTHSEPLAF